MTRQRILGFVAAVGVTGGFLGGHAPVARAALTAPAFCQSGSAWAITPLKTGGATYTITHGGGFCIQGSPFAGDWSVAYSGAGRAATFSCTPSGAVVGGLVLNLHLVFVNNKTGVVSTVNEVWTESSPSAPINLTNFAIAPGVGLHGQVETHIFNQCPPKGTPSTYLQWTDTNPS